VSTPLRRPWLAAASAIVVAAAGVTVTAVTSAQAAASCQVTYSVSSQWPGGFGANVSITNLGSPITSWQLSWSFGAGQTIQQLWNGSYTQSGGNVTVTNASYNGSLATGGNTSFGFNGAWNGSNPNPTAFTLNGTLCTGVLSSGTPTPTPTATASASASPSMSASASPSASSTGSPPPPSLPCDIYAAGGTPCIAAHSTTRALYASYNGPLY